MRSAFLLLAVLNWPCLAWAGDEHACMTAIAEVGRATPIPSRALQAIAVVESGRPIGGRVVPWPWSVNADGVGRYYASKAEAVSGIEALRAAGLQSIDVGCMQVNLAAHPDAFRSFEDALDPAVNVGYAARFFLSLYQQTGRWTVAMTAYHSRTPSLAADYAQRLLSVWPQAASFGLTADGPRDAADQAGRSTLVSERSALLAAALPTHGAAWPLPTQRH